jgi:hypothetical protein
MNIDWNLTDHIFLYESNKIVRGGENINGYCDNEVNDKTVAAAISKDLADINMIIMEFESTFQGSFQKILQSPCVNDFNSTCKWYQNSEYRLELWTDDEDGFGVIFGSIDSNQIRDFLVCSNHGGHPLIMTKGFYFSNSDGSTGVDIDINSLSLEQLKKYLCKITTEYITDQYH